MKSWTKKLVVYSLIGTLQCGLGATISEAASHREDPGQPGQRQEERRWQNDRERERYEEQRRHEEACREEQRRHEEIRHEREMQRRDHESYRVWRERQRHEESRHDDALKAIAAAAALYLIFDNN